MRLAHGAGLGSLLLAVLVTWAALTSVDVVVTAPAEARPMAGIFEVRAATSGVVRRVAVAEGDTVAAGDRLVDLEAQSAEGRWRAAQAALEVRRRVLREDRTLLAALDRQAVDRWPGAARSRFDEYRNTLARLDREADALAVEVDAARARTAAASRRHEIAQARHRAAEEAFQRGAISRFDLFTARESLWLRNDELDSAAGRVRVLKNRLAAQRHGRREIVDGFRSDLLAAVAAGDAELASLEADLADAVRQRRLSRIESPAAGTIERLAAAPGEYVERGEVLGVVVPGDAVLLFEARIEPAQTAFLSSGLPCRLKLDALPFARYGALPCVVERIGRDAVRPGDGPPHYVARVRPSSERLMADGSEFRLQAGATAWVDIVAGQRTVLGFFTEPLQRFAREALRER